MPSDSGSWIVTAERFTSHNDHDESRVSDINGWGPSLRYTWKEEGLNTAVQLRSASGVTPSKLFIRSLSLKMYAGRLRKPIVKVPWPIAAKGAPFAVLSTATGGWLVEVYSVLVGTSAFALRIRMCNAPESTIAHTALGECGLVAGRA